MQTFDFTTKAKIVRSLERNFGKVHNALNEIALPITVRGEIDTLLQKQQDEMTQDILTGKLVSKEHINIENIKEGLPVISSIIGDTLKEEGK